MPVVPTHEDAPIVRADDAGHADVVRGYRHLRYVQREFTGGARVAGRTDVGDAVERHTQEDNLDWRGQDEQVLDLVDEDT